MYGKLDNCQASQSLLCALGIKHPNEKSAQETFISKEIKEPNDMNYEENTSKSRTVAVESEMEAMDGPTQPRMSFECPECGKLFVALDALYKHLELCEKDTLPTGNISSQTFF